MAWALVIVFAVLAAVALAWLVTTRSKLAAQRAATATAEAAGAARVAEVEAGAAEAARSDAGTMESLRGALADATARAEQAERDRAIDPGVLWSLERARSERTWRFSVAVGPDSVSALREAGPDETSTSLVEALHVELDAAREDVGAVVELDADIPDGIAPAGAVIVLRIAQELLADVVRRSESTTLRVATDGDDLVVAVEGVDSDGNPARPAPLPLPPSPSIRIDDDSSVRIVGAARRTPGSLAAADLDTTREIVAPDPADIGDAMPDADAEADGTDAD